MKRNYSTIPTLLISTVLFFYGCIPDCIQKGPPAARYSSNIEESKKNGVFQYQVFIKRDEIHLTTNLSFKIKAAWIENDWDYECINNKSTKVIHDWKHLIVQSEYIGRLQNGVHFFLGRHQIGTTKHYSLEDGMPLRYYIYKDTTDFSPELELRSKPDSIKTASASRIAEMNHRQKLRIIDSVEFVPGHK